MNDDVVVTTQQAQKALPGLDASLFRNPKKKNTEVTDTSLKVYVDLVASGYIKTHKDFILSQIKALAEICPGSFTGSELYEFIKLQYVIPPTSDERSWCCRPISKLRDDDGILLRVEDRLPVVHTPDLKSRCKQPEISHILLDTPQKIKKVPPPNKKFFPEMLESIRDGLILLYRFELSEGGDIESWEKKHRAFLSMKDYLVYRTQVEGRGLPHIQKEKDVEVQEQEVDS